MSQECRVWNMYQARCMLCPSDDPDTGGPWSGEIHGSSGAAASDAAEHRATGEHKRRVTQRQNQRRPKRGMKRREAT